MKNILVLGAGHVSRPLVKYLLARTPCRVTLASRSRDKVERILGGHPRGVPVQLQIEDDTALEELIRSADVIVSLVPYLYHVKVAELAIRHRVNVVTTSYVSPEMQALDEKARAAGVLILNEMGLDPGIDHMSAMQVIHRVQGAGGRVFLFSSCCGGLPAAEANTNPWGYKFSWSPRGVILAGRNAARYLKHGEVKEIPGPEVFHHRWLYHVEGVGLFETYANRDSLAYIDTYGLNGIENMFRGTIRYRGWCHTVRSLAKLTVLDDVPRTWKDGATYADFMDELLPNGGGPLVLRLANYLEVPLDDPLISRLEWAGLLSQRPIPDGPISPLDVLVHRLERLLGYQPWERDMIVLRHEFLAEWEGRRPRERIVSMLVDYGDPDGDSAMSRTVSLPAAIAARHIIEGDLDLSGVHIPVLPEIYVPVLQELGELGIRFEERAEQLLTTPFDGDQTPGASLQPFSD